MKKKANRIGILEGRKFSRSRSVSLSAAQINEALKAQGYQTLTIDIGQTRLTDQILAFKPDVIFPALHGPVGEDGTIQGFLEILAIPYVGSNVRGSALAMDKNVSKKIFDSLAIPTAAGIMVDELPISIHSLQQNIEENLGEKIIIKPVNQGSALGVEIVSDLSDLKDQTDQIIRLWPLFNRKFYRGQRNYSGRS